MLCEYGLESVIKDYEERARYMEVWISVYDCFIRIFLSLDTIPKTEVFTSDHKLYYCI